MSLRPLNLFVGGPLGALQTVCEGSCKSFPPGIYHTQVFAGLPVANPSLITVRVVAKLKNVKISLAVGDEPTSAKLRVGQTLDVAIHPASLEWVGDANLEPTLKADDPCATTCSEPERAFTALRSAHAAIITVRNCHDTQRGPETALCVLGPKVDVTVADNQLTESRYSSGYSSRFLARPKSVGVARVAGDDAAAYGNRYSSCPLGVAVGGAGCARLVSSARPSRSVCVRMAVNRHWLEGREGRCR
jgi:hypothetical protein